jgi:hypothetical protein
MVSLKRSLVRVSILGVGFAILVSGAMMVPFKAQDGEVGRTSDNAAVSGMGRAPEGPTPSPSDELESGAVARPPERSAEAAPEEEPASGGGPPSSASACGAFPRFPDSGCTGWEYTGVTLRDCPNTITTAGAELDGCLFSNGLTVEAANVTITRSRIEGLVRPRGDLQNLTLTDVEIDGTGHVDPASEDSQLAIGNENYTCLRCDIHDTGRGANLGNNVRIEDSYLHDFPFMNGKHMTAIGSNGGANFSIIHNNLECSVSGCSAALSFYGDFAPIRDVLVQYNLFNTTGSYCTYGGSVDGKEYPVGTNIRYLDNRFGKKFHDSCGQFGPVASFSSGSGNAWQRNSWQDGSGSVTP